jgi:hypothetical protein
VAYFGLANDYPPVASLCALLLDYLPFQLYLCNDVRDRGQYWTFPAYGYVNGNPDDVFQRGATLGRKFPYGFRVESDRIS